EGGRGSAAGHGTGAVAPGSTFQSCACTRSDLAARGRAPSMGSLSEDRSRVAVGAGSEATPRTGAEPMMRDLDCTARVVTAPSNPESTFRASSPTETRAGTSHDSFCALRLLCRRTAPDALGSWSRPTVQEPDARLLLLQAAKEVSALEQVSSSQMGERCRTINDVTRI